MGSTYNYVSIITCCILDHICSVALKTVFHYDRIIVAGCKLTRDVPTSLGQIFSLPSFQQTLCGPPLTIGAEIIAIKMQEKGLIIDVCSKSMLNQTKCMDLLMVLQ